MKKLLVMFFAVMFCITFVSSYSYVLQEDTLSDVKIACFDTDNLYCTSTTNCTITIYNSDQTVLINNDNMSYNENYFNYTFTPTKIGEYPTVVNCVGGTAAYSTFEILVTNSGYDGIAIEWVLIFVLLLAYGLIIFGFYREEHPPVTMGAIILLVTALYIWINGFGILGAKSLISQFIAAANFIVGAFLTVQALGELKN